MSYLFEPSVLDVELLGIHEVKKFAVLFPKGKEKDRGRGLKARNISVPEMCLGVQRKKEEGVNGVQRKLFSSTWHRNKNWVMQVCGRKCQSGFHIQFSQSKPISIHFLHFCALPLCFHQWWYGPHFLKYCPKLQIRGTCADIFPTFPFKLLQLHLRGKYCKFYSTTFV